VTATWNIPRSHLTTTDRYSLPLSTVYGRIVLTAVLTPPPSPTSTRSILRILHTTGRRPYLEPSAVPVGDRLVGTGSRSWVKKGRTPITGGFNVGGPEKLRRPDFPDP
jgi:hypothetical protein